MKSVAFVFLFSCFSLTIISCSEKDDFDIIRWEKIGTSNSYLRLASRQPVQIV